MRRMMFTHILIFLLFATFSSLSRANLTAAQIAKLPTELDRPLQSPFGGSCKITSGFGPRVHPLNGGANSHMAVDIVPDGQGFRDGLLHPPAPGIIEAVNKTGDMPTSGTEQVSDGRKDGCGCWVRTRVTQTRSIQMCHMTCDSEAIQKLKVGETIDTKEPIGKMGMTGSATGPHVHFIITDSDIAADLRRRLGVVKIAAPKIGLSATPGAGEKIAPVDPTNDIERFCKISSNGSGAGSGGGVNQ